MSAARNHFSLWPNYKSASFVEDNKFIGYLGGIYALVHAGKKKRT